MTHRGPAHIVWFKKHMNYTAHVSLPPTLQTAEVLGRGLTPSAANQETPALHKSLSLIIYLKQKDADPL